jgi:hypothetical protein
MTAVTENKLRRVGPRSNLKNQSNPHQNKAVQSHY